MFFLITLVADFNLMFLLSQSERLQDRCQPGAAGNRSDQHHGLLCVSLPCHRQLWEVCVCYFLSYNNSYVYTDMFSFTSRTAVNSQTGVCTPAGGVVTSKL